MADRETKMKDILKLEEISRKLAQARKVLTSYENEVHIAHNAYSKAIADRNLQEKHVYDLGIEHEKATQAFGQACIDVYAEN